EPAVRDEIDKRASAAAKRDELGALAASQLATEARVIVDPRTLPAAGVVDAATPATAATNALPAMNAPGAASPARSASIATAARSAASGNGNGNGGDGNGSAHASPAAAPAIDLEKALAGLDDKLAFVGLEEGAQLAASQ